MVRNRAQAAAAAEKQHTNAPGSCQKTTRGWFNAPSAGDRDHDGDADANDGWLSEPVSARHVGDRNPPGGVPLYFKNKSGRGFGHRAISRFKKGSVKSTDMSNGRYAPGVTGIATIAQIEKAMGLVYIGWSETITGIQIPLSPAAVKPPSPNKPVKKSIIFKTATSNVQSLPKLKTIISSLNAVAGTHLWGHQEVDPKSYKLEVFKKFPQSIGIGTAKTPRGNTYSCPIGFARGTFEKRWARTEKLYDGEEGISLTRHLTTASFNHKASGFDVGFINLHSVVIKADRKAKRQAMKLEAKKAVFAATREHLKSGTAAIVVGDINDKANWFGKTFDGHKVQRITNGIDQMFYIDGDHHRFEILTQSVRKTNADHLTLRGKVRLIEK